MSMFWLRRRDLLALGLTVAGLSVSVAAGAERNWRWAVDYGAHTDPAAARSYDLLVLEPDHARPIAPLRGPDTRLLGYISMGEVHRDRPYVEGLGRQGALRKANPNWPDARLVDLRSAAWQALVLDRLIPDILAKGYDGIFMDTLDNAEAMERQDRKASDGMVAGAVRLVRAIRARFPGMAVMMNRGYALLPDVAGEIDLVLGEAMASRWNFSSRRYEMTSPDDWTWQAERLRAARAVNPSLILTTLDYWDPADKTTIASLYAREREAGFNPYVATLDLNRIYPEPVA